MRWVAKSCPRDRYHKPLEGSDVTLSAGCAAQLRHAVVKLILAPEWKTYEDTLAVVEGQESTGICAAECTAHDDMGAVKTVQGISLIAPTLE